ncbi:M18 family aminopeptidase [Congregibacter litoralis]|uniref:M18 family aminopeptidase n=1 Tax=Congregibacter litoralis KT71 TaxID=314285 RepID=A4A3T4_9GAMM|nr:M18 family aminopeptidase [Congregibacter litoralis]EAQ99357.1 Aspartyl aminopeptidase [Congregibacter litoralis KT71]
MNKDVFNEGLLTFLSEATTPFHAVKALSRRLREAGFAPLDEHSNCSPGSGGVFYEQAGSIIALRPGSGPLLESGLRMVGAHTDSPCLMVKPQPEQRNLGYLQLGIEVYGGALLNPWFDRDLSLAGRVSYEDDKGAVATSLVDFRDPIAIVPSLAIHLDREANKNRSVNAQLQMAPLLALNDEKFCLRDFLREHLRERDLEVAEVLDYELCFYDTQPPAQIGLKGEFIASARLDNLLSCYTGLQALLEADGSQWSLLICNDHEEVGSRSASGAQGPMLQHFIQGLLPDAGALPLLMQRSMMISADNAHAVHPSYPDKHDEQHGPMLNGGPVIKVNASQRYATSSDGAALFRVLARQESVDVQSFAMRADMACGSTIGPITAGELGVTTLDIGVPTFAMHSIRELAGSDDAWALHRVLSAYFRQPAPLFAGPR